MAHNTRIRANFDAWANGTAVTQAEYDALDQAQFEAINGDDGGVWAPATEIEIGGQGLNCSGPFTGLDSATFGGMSVGTIKTDVANLQTSRTVAGTAVYSISSGGSYATGAAMTIAASSVDAGFTLTGGNTIEVPAAGTYLVTVSFTMTSDSAANPLKVGARGRVGGVEFMRAETYRWTTNTGQSVRVSGSGIARIVTPATETIQLEADHGAGVANVVGSTLSRITLTRVSAP